MRIIIDVDTDGGPAPTASVVGPQDSGLGEPISAGPAPADLVESLASTPAAEATSAGAAPDLE